MAIQNLYPAVRPTLDLNFAGSKTVDPRITFTRNSSATYFGSDGLLKTAAANEPRIDYDPVTGECKGFLVEESRTNLHLRSQDFSTGWSLSSDADSSLTASAAFAPDGTATAGSFLCSTTNKISRRLYTSENISVTENTTYTASAYIKSVNWSWVGVGLAFGTGYTTNAALGRVNLSTGQTVLQLGLSITLTNVGNGWYRVVISGTTPETMTGARFSFVLLDAGEGIAGTAIGVVGAGIYVWGAQLEVGSFPTSYIKTEATAVTRAADSAVMTGANFSSWYRQDEGTMVAEINDLRVGSVITSNAGIFDVRQSAGDEINTRMLRSFSGVNGSLGLQISDANGVSYNPADSGGVLTSVDQFGKVGLAYKWGDYAVASEMGLLSANRTLVGAAPLVASVLYIGALNNGSQFQSTRHIKRLAYYPKRLTNDQLVALTQ